MDGPAGTLAAIWIKRNKRGPMDGAVHAELVAGRGIVGNANQGGRRQVTLIEAEVWAELMAGLGADLPSSGRRANLVVRGLPLAGSRGRVLSVGGCRLRVGGETRPCERMDELLPGLRARMGIGGAGGVFAEVLVGGRVTLGDRVGWAEPAQPAETAGTARARHP